MSRKSNRQTGVRARIAATAARIMAEDGIEDFALAKRKAARRLCAPEAQALPGNDEIEAELRSYRALYQAAEPPLPNAEPPPRAAARPRVAARRGRPLGDARPWRSAASTGCARWNASIHT